MQATLHEAAYRLLMKAQFLHGDRAAALQELLRETAVALQNTPRQAKLYRALRYTYIQPAPTLEKAAELLAMPFSTYRRHLRSGIQYVTERLWQLELSAAAW